MRRLLSLGIVAGFAASSLPDPNFDIVQLPKRSGVGPRGEMPIPSKQRKKLKKFKRAARQKK